MNFTGKHNAGVIGLNKVYCMSIIVCIAQLVHVYTTGTHRGSSVVQYSTYMYVLLMPDRKSDSEEPEHEKNHTLVSIQGVANCFGWVIIL